MTAEPVPETTEYTEFGEDDDVEEERRGFLRTFADDPRLVPVVAGLAGVAVFGSLISEWLVIGSRDGFDQIRQGVAGMGGPGAAYLVGVLLLAGLLMTVIAGPHRARRLARIAGLGVAGAMLAIVLGVRISGSLYVEGWFYGANQLPSIAYGRGITAALAGILLAGLALVLAGRRSREVAVDDEDDEVDEEPHPPAVDWAWRRPRRQTVHPDAEPGPIELTVKPANPFARPES